MAYALGVPRLRPRRLLPHREHRPALEQIETARRICAACAVNDECLEFALATNQEAGIWGGTTEEERRKLRKAWLAKQRVVRQLRRSDAIAVHGVERLRGSSRRRGAAAPSGARGCRGRCGSSMVPPSSLVTSACTIDSPSPLRLLEGEPGREPDAVVDHLDDAADRRRARAAP